MLPSPKLACLVTLSRTLPISFQFSAHQYRAHQAHVAPTWPSFCHHSVESRPTAFSSAALSHVEVTPKPASWASRRKAAPQRWALLQEVVGTTQLLTPEEGRDNFFFVSFSFCSAAGSMASRTHLLKRAVSSSSGLCGSLVDSEQCTAS